MARKDIYNAEDLRKQAKRLLASGLRPTWQHLSDAMHVPIASLRYQMRKLGITAVDEIAESDAYASRARSMPVYTDVRKAERRERVQDGAAIEYSSVSVSGQVKTEDDLIRACRINLKERTIVFGEHRKWDVTLKLKRGDGTDRMVVVPQFYVRLRRLPKHPEPIQPVLRPLQLNVKISKPKAPRPGRMNRALIIADPQVGFRRRLHTQDLMPFHDRRVLDVALQVAQREDIDGIYLIGDCLDMSEWSMKFLTEPEFYWTTQPALIEWAWWLTQYRQAAPNATMDQFEGNHEMRPEDMLITHMKAAYGLRPVDELELPASLSIERLLALHTLRVNYVKGYPDNKLWLNNNVLIRHGDVIRANPGDTAKAVVSKTTYTTVFGHAHRRELVSRRIAGREGDIFQTAFCPGCACHVDGRVPGSKSDDQWQQGIAVIEYMDDFEAIIPIPIENGRAIYRGQVLEARDRTDEIDTMLLKRLKEIQ